MCRAIDLTNASTRATYLTAQLRESAPYLADVGWHQTAQLLTAAATEIERLQVHRMARANEGLVRVDCSPSSNSILSAR